MLELRNISKEYKVGDSNVGALDNINLVFPDTGLVSILGPSGSGKSTMLNIIGGLDQYTTGDLIINGVSTKKYKDRDWDTYRNHSVGFVFQSYNLIPHQNVLSNVELALTLSGVGKFERRERAKEALENVGLSKHLYKKPALLSGGEKQRVAVARALVNKPSILICDEPTGALDSVTSVKIMELLKEISKDKLVIMVTHNPDLAEEYSDRIIKISDGKIIEDSSPCNEKGIEKEKAKKIKNTSMGFFTALSLSFKNLLTKKGRTILTSFAGSIGIIGIAAILALSNGVQNYIDRVQEDTLSSYPLTIEGATFDITSVMQSIIKSDVTDNTYVDKDTLYVRPIINDVLSTVSSQIKVNNLKDFKVFLESEDNNIKDYLNGIQYSYGLDVLIYKENDSKQGYIQSNPNDIVSSIGFSNFTGGSNQFAGVEQIASSSIWTKLLDNEELMESQYDLIAGKWPENYNEVVLTVDKYNQLNDYVLYSLGFKNQDEIKETFEKIQKGEKVEEFDGYEMTYDDFVGETFKILLHTDFFEKNGDIWVDKSEDEEFIKELLNKAEELTIVGIIRQDEQAVATSMTGSIGYLAGLEEYVINSINESEIVKEQKENKDINVLTGLSFSQQEFDMTTLTPEQQQYLASLTPEQIAEMMEKYTSNVGATYKKNLKKFGVVNLDNPSTIYLYAKDFDSKAEIENIIKQYNKDMEAQGKEENKITYTDLVGIMISSVSKIVDVVAYVLMAFVSISLVVSSIMIGIITYISVLERTKEIGILRAIGASKKDISRVFNAEALIIGFSSGCLGILVTWLLTIPANIIIKDLTGVANIAELPPVAAVILVLISVFLTFIAGLFPSRLAAKKDPVESLRSE